MAFHNNDQSSAGVNQDGRDAHATGTVAQGLQDMNQQLNNVIGEFKLPCLGPNHERLLDADAIEDTNNTPAAVNDPQVTLEGDIPAYLHEDIVAGLIDMGFTRFNQLQKNILRSFIKRAVPVQIMGNVRACGTTTAALVAIADQVVKHQCSSPPPANAANAHGRSAPVAICAFDTQEQAQEANKFLRQILAPFNKKSCADNKLQIQVGLFQGGLSGGRSQFPATGKSDTSQSSGQILCATPGRMMDSYEKKILTTGNLRFFFAENVSHLVSMKDFCKGALPMLRAAKDNKRDVRVITTSCTIPDHQRAHLRNCIFIFHDTAPTPIFLQTPSVLIKNQYEFVRLSDPNDELQELWDYIQKTWVTGRGQDGRNLLIFTKTIIHAREIANFLRRRLQEMTGLDHEETMRIVGELHSKLPFGTVMKQKIRSHHGYSKFNDDVDSGMRFLVATPLSYDLEYSINPDVLITGVDDFTLWNFFQSRTGRRGYDGQVITFIDARDKMEHAMASQIMHAMTENSHAVPSVLADICDTKVPTWNGPGASTGVGTGSTGRGRPGNTASGNTRGRSGNNTGGNTVRGGTVRGRYVRGTRGRGGTVRGGTRGRGHPGNTPHGNTLPAGANHQVPHASTINPRQADIDGWNQASAPQPMSDGPTTDSLQAFIDDWSQASAPQPVSDDPTTDSLQAFIDDWSQASAPQPVSDDPTTNRRQAETDECNQFSASQPTGDSPTRYTHAVDGVAVDESPKSVATESEDTQALPTKPMTEEKKNVGIEMSDDDVTSTESPTMSGGIPALNDCTSNSDREGVDHLGSMQPPPSGENTATVALLDAQLPLIVPTTSKFTTDVIGSVEEAKAQKEPELASAPSSPSGKDTAPSLLLSNLPYSTSMPIESDPEGQTPLAPMSPSPSVEEDEAPFVSAPPSPIPEDTAPAMHPENPFPIAAEGKAQLESAMLSIPADPIRGEAAAVLASDTTDLAPDEQGKEHSKVEKWYRKLFRKPLAKFQCE